jgi:membrane-associated protease RseP (regulator of RpoE activity)
MARCLCSLLVGALVWAPARAQPVVPPAAEKGTYLGVLWDVVPEVLYNHLPQLPRERGVLVTHVLPDSPAARAGLRRHDILLQYGDEKIRDSTHFARLIVADKPDRKVKLLLVRSGKDLTADVTLALGPALKIVLPGKADVKDVPRGLAKATPPAAVSVSATPLGDGTMRVVIEYYPEGAGRLRTVTCSGTPAQIEGEVQRLPARVQPLARSALERIRALEFQKAGK